MFNPDYELWATGPVLLPGKGLKVLTYLHDWSSSFKFLGYSLQQNRAEALLTHHEFPFEMTWEQLSRKTVGRYKDIRRFLLYVTSDKNTKTLVC
jgi:hypothetical protein